MIAKVAKLEHTRQKLNDRYYCKSCDAYKEFTYMKRSNRKAMMSKDFVMVACNSCKVTGWVYEPKKD